MGIEKITVSQRVVKAVEGGKFFFQLLELGYGKFPHNTTDCTAVRFSVLSIDLCI